MRRHLRFLLLVLATAAWAMPGRAAVTVHASIDPPEVNVGDEATLTYTLSGSVQDFQLPAVDGLNVEATSVSSQFMLNGMSFSQSYSHTFLIVANRAGNIIIPAFDIHDEGGQVVARTQAITLHVLGGSGSAPTASRRASSMSSPPKRPLRMWARPCRSGSNLISSAPPTRRRIRCPPLSAAIF
jgi:hypothetical protein